MYEIEIESHKIQAEGKVRQGCLLPRCSGLLLGLRILVSGGQGSNTVYSLGKRCGSTSTTALNGFAPAVRATVVARLENTFLPTRAGLINLRIHPDIASNMKAEDSRSMIELTDMQNKLSEPS
jgi:hypothetical protein